MKQLAGTMGSLAKPDQMSTNAVEKASGAATNMVGASLKAGVAPGAESVLHTLNTLDHVVLMAPHLRHASCEVDVPMLGASGRAEPP